MRVVVEHSLTKEAAIPRMDQALDKLLSGDRTSNLEIIDQKKEWNGSIMSFSFTGKVGFISLPMAGTIEVEDSNVAVEMELPALAKNFVGEEKIRGIVDENVRELLHA